MASVSHGTEAGIYIYIYFNDITLFPSKIIITKVIINELDTKEKQHSKNTKLPNSHGLYVFTVLQ